MVTTDHPARVSCASLDVRRGLTVLELLVTIGIISVLMALLLPAVHSARESARRIQCQNNLRQIGLALHQHHEATGNLPPGWTLKEGGVFSNGWATSILPWLEQSALQESVSNSLTTVTPAVFICPSDSAERLFQLYAEDEDETEFPKSAAPLPLDVLVELPHANYLGVFGTSDPDKIGEIDGGGTFIARDVIRFRDLTNGLSQVAVVAERTARRLPSTWLGFHVHGEDAAARVLGFASLGPNRAEADECEFDSRHPGCINMLFADGHVRSIAEDIDSSVYRHMAKRCD
jgi:prepilin-type processing-associated H-X9-DG protein/prepilin-type N-terminal cleavage/methylation domain-containing protein